MNNDAFVAEGEFLERVAELGSKYSISAERNTQSITAAAICAALEEFMESVRYLNTRRAETSLSLVSEAAVQDAIFLMLRPWVHDLIPETPTDRIASRFTIKDFRSATARTIIEAKYVRDRDHGRLISRELHDDIETYRTDLLCEHLIFFIYDPDVHIPDKAALQRQIEVERYYDGKRLHCYVIARP
jgi:predicted RNA polymerase sigma factor